MSAGEPQAVQRGASWIPAVGSAGLLAVLLLLVIALGVPRSAPATGPVTPTTSPSPQGGSSTGAHH